MKDQLDMLGQAQQAGVADQFFMAQNALNRRNHFESVDAAYTYFAGKRLFQDWPERTLRLYVEDGTKPAPDGDGLVLRFDPAWEANYFASAYALIWDDLPRLNNLLPTLFIQGTASDTFLPPLYEAVQEIVPSADYRQVEGHGHLFPQSAPTETAQIIREWLASVND
jgi:pimeloyl-ACP methyl ester carboxylesterase